MISSILEPYPLDAVAPPYVTSNMAPDMAYVPCVSGKITHFRTGVGDRPNDRELSCTGIYFLPSLFTV